MKKTLLYILIPLLALLIIGGIIGIAASSCSDDESNLPPVTSGSVVVTPNSSIPTDVEPNIRGFITRITYSAESTELLVEYLGSGENYTYSYKTAKITVDEKTAVADSSGAVSSFSVGQTVEVWTGSASGESNPVIAYGQAVLIDLSAPPICGVRGIPQLTVNSGSSSNYITMISDASWRDKEYAFGKPNELLSQVLGAHISAAAGDNAILSFGKQPDSCSAVYYEKSYSTPNPLEITDGRFVIPEAVNNQFYVCVTACYGENTVNYWFAIAVISA